MAPFLFHFYGQFSLFLLDTYLVNMWILHTGNGETPMGHLELKMEMAKMLSLKLTQHPPDNLWALVGRRHRGHAHGPKIWRTPTGADGVHPVQPSEVAESSRRRGPPPTASERRVSSNLMHREVSLLHREISSLSPENLLAATSTHLPGTTWRCVQTMGSRAGTPGVFFCSRPYSLHSIES